MSWQVVVVCGLILALLIEVGSRLYVRYLRWRSAREWARLIRERSEVDARLRAQLREIDQERQGR